MKTLSIDIETYSDVPLQKSGVYRYCESPNFEILLFGYSADSGPVQVVDLACGEKIPADVLDALTDDAVTKWAFNASFERVCLSRYLRELGISLDPFHDKHPLSQEMARFLNPESWRCSMVWAATMGLPLSLEGVGSVLGLEKQKLTEGKEAEVLSKYFSKELRYSPATHFIRYSDHYWQESEPGAQAVAHELTRRQMKEAGRDLLSALEKMKNSGAQTILDGTTKSKAEQLMSDEQLQAYQEFLAAQAYRAFVIKRRDSKNITSTLKESHPMLEISPRDLDADCFALNTPEATYDLRLGMAGAREHSPEDFITKITSVTPGSKGQQIWQDCLDLIFQCNQELIDYVQMICGLAAIGKVYVEALIIAYGDGRNGKSTFWNAISRVLGLYSGNISADTLTVGCRRNIKPEMAEVKGKRLLIAAEMQEGARLNDSTVKQLCSTDDVFAEKKYKDPFSFKPCHTLVLYTNHLPRVSASDDGIWRRLIVIPFNAKITGKSDIKNYGEYLYDNAGESILAWVIEGAKKVIALEYQIPVPKCVQDAIREYRSQNDWFGHFIEDKCDTGDDYKESSSSLYQAYRNYCIDTNEYVRSTADFYFALESAGFERVVLNRKRYFKGLRIRTEDNAGDDFLK